MQRIDVGSLQTTVKLSPEVQAAIDAVLMKIQEVQNELEMTAAGLLVALNALADDYETRCGESAVLAAARAAIAKADAR